MAVRALVLLPLLHVAGLLLLLASAGACGRGPRPCRDALAAAVRRTVLAVSARVLRVPATPHLS